MYQQDYTTVQDINENNLLHYSNTRQQIKEQSLIYVDFESQYHEIDKRGSISLMIKNVNDRSSQRNHKDLPGPLMESIYKLLVYMCETRTTMVSNYTTCDIRANPQ